MVKTGTDFMILIVNIFLGINQFHPSNFRSHFVLPFLCLSLQYYCALSESCSAVAVLSCVSFPSPHQL